MQQRLQFFLNLLPLLTTLILGNVFINDPTRGYGIFIENMLAEAEKIK